MRAPPVPAREAGARYGSWPGIDDTDARLAAAAGLGTALITRLGVGRRGPVEELDLVSHPAWQFLDLPENDLEEILSMAAETVKASESMVK